MPAAPFLAALLDALLPARCVACAAPADDDDTWCAPCREQLSPAPAGGAFVYAGPLADAIRRAKAGRDVAVARALARWWGQATTSTSTSTSTSPSTSTLGMTLPACDAVTFVPAPWQRRLARGFDLPALLAASLASTERPLVEALVATRNDPRLSASGSRDERAALVLGRFAVRRTRAFEEHAGATLLVVDDVHTTGATLGAACAALTEAGVRAVPWALAVTPPS